jgi:hypothetical protein
LKAEKNSSNEIEKLVTLLPKELSEERISFREESDRERRYTLRVSTSDTRLLRRLAHVFGCPNPLLPDSHQTQFEASDSWHGHGAVDLRALADELIPRKGEFFDFDIAVGDLPMLASRGPAE